MTNAISTADRLVKVGLALTKLTIGESRVDAAKEVMTVLKNGNDLMSDLNAQERSMGKRLIARADEHIAKVAGQPDFPAGKLEDAKAHLFEALYYATPSADALYMLSMQKEPAAVAEAMLANAIEAEPKATFAIAYADNHHRRFFLTVVSGFLADLRDSRDDLDAMLPSLWRDLLTKVDAMDEKLDRLLARTGNGVAKAEAAGIQHFAIVQLAKRISRDVEDFDQAMRELDRAVDIAIEVQEQGHQHSNLGAFVDDVLTRMAALSAEGKDDEASAEADRAFEQWQREEAERQEKAKAEGIRLLNAGVRHDLLRRDAKAAAARVVQRVELETADAANLFDALFAEQDAWYVRGRDKGVNLDLEVSIEIARLAYKRTADVDQRGTALNNLGNALSTLGERESGTERLEQAVATYRAVLEELTRDSVPLKWAMTQNNLGNALVILGNRESGTRRLEEASVTLRSALKELPRESAPLDWAMAQNNLGLALLWLGRRDRGTRRLKEAVRAFRAALEEQTRDRVSFDWAMSQNNLGIALTTLGERERDTSRLEEAVEVHRAALEEWTRDRVPLNWAMTQNNLGIALTTLGESECDTERLEEAVEAYLAALEERTRDRVPLLWATTQNNLGNALATLGEWERNTEQLVQAVAAYRAALNEWIRDRVPLDWAFTQGNLADVEIAFFEKTGDASHLDKADNHVRLALEVFEEAGATHYIGFANAQLTRIADLRKGA